MNRTTSLLSLGLLLGCAASGFGQDAPHTRRVIVKYKPGYASFQNGSRSPISGQGEVAVFHSNNVRSAVNFYKTQPGVAYAEPEYILRATEASFNDPYRSQQWSLGNMNWNPAAEMDWTGKSVVVAVIDSGVNPDILELQGKLLPGYDFIQNDSTPQDGHGHGTFCASLIAAVSNNNIGIVGMAPNAKILPIRSLDNDGSGTTTTVAEGIVWATDNGAKVINMSLGSTGSSQLLQEAISYARARGVVLVAAAGNDGDTVKSYPAGNSGVIAVAATKSDNARAGFSTYGNWVQLAAPGQGILGIGLENDVEGGSGTSFAAPHVAGLAAMVMGTMGSEATPAAVEERLFTTADAVGDFVSRGKINVGKALETPTLLPGNLTLRTQEVVGGAKVEATYVLGSTATTAQTYQVTFSSQNAVSRSSFTVRPGESRKTFLIVTRSVASAEQVTVTVWRNGLTKDASFTLSPIVLDSLRFDPTPIRSGRTGKLQVRLNGKTFENMNVTLTSSDPSVLEARSSVSVRRGSNSVFAQVRAKSVTTTRTVTLTATCNGVTKSIDVTVQP